MRHRLADSSERPILQAVANRLPIHMDTIHAGSFAAMNYLSFFPTVW